MEPNETQSGGRPILVERSKGNTPLSVGLSGFAYGIVLLNAVPAALSATIAKLADKKEFLSEFFEYMRKPVFGKVGVILGAGLSAVYGMAGYAVQKQTQREHDKLLADNIAMRSQLNETGQILRHVANQVEKGKLADSEITMTNEAPPSHVARLEAQQAAAAAQEELIKL